MLVSGVQGSDSVIHMHVSILSQGSPGGSEVKASACNAGDLGSIPELGRSPEMATHFSMLAWRIPLMEETGGLQSTMSQRVRQD